MNRKNYAQWVNARLSDFQHNCMGKVSIASLIDTYRRTASGRFLTRIGSPTESGAITYGNFIISWDFYTRLVTIFNIMSHKYGQSKAAKEDDFCITEGIAIAWAHYNKMPIPSLDKTIEREKLVNGDKFISSVNQSKIVTFIGWCPNMKNGTIGKWAVVLEERDKPIKTQIAETVIKIN